MAKCWPSTRTRPRFIPDSSRLRPMPREARAASVRTNSRRAHVGPGRTHSLRKQPFRADQNSRPCGSVLKPCNITESILTFPSNAQVTHSWHVLPPFRMPLTGSDSFPKINTINDLQTVFNEKSHSALQKTVLQN